MRQEHGRRRHDYRRERDAAPKTKRPFDRRRLLRNGGLSLASLTVLGAIKAWGGDPGYVDNRAPIPAEFETFSMKRNSLNVVISEHQDVDWEPNKEKIIEAIDHSDYVIPEYYPFEYQQLGHSLEPIDTQIASYLKANALFDHVAEVCIEKEKPVWVVDPEYNRDGAKLRAVLESPKFLGALAMFVGTPDTFIQGLYGYLNRRQVLTRFGVSFFGGFALVAETDEYRRSIENDFRHVVSAELLDRVDERIASSSEATDKKTMTMIIPKTHWDGIKTYLLDPEARQQRLERYKSIFGDVFPSLFEARYHAPGDRSGNPQEKISLLN